MGRVTVSAQPKEEKSQVTTPPETPCRFGQKQHGKHLPWLLLSYFSW